MNATEHGGLEGRPSREATAAPEARIRCVLLARRDARERTEDLVALLERRGVDVAVRHDAFGAIAAALQGGGGGPAAVVVVDPDDWPRANELMAALERFAPHVARWRFDGDPEPQLRGFGTTAASGKPDVHVNANGVERFRNGVAARANERPALRLAGVEDEGEAEAPVVEDVKDEAVEGAGDSAEERASAPAPLASSILTEEELRMLLSDDPPEKSS